MATMQPSVVKHEERFVWFRRLRTTIQVLSHQPEEFVNEPDIIFLSESAKSKSRISLAIGGLIESVALVAFAAFLGHQIGKALAPVGLSGTAAPAAAALGVLSYLYIHRLNEDFRLRLKIGERLAPYFGHKIEEAYRILKG